MKSSIRRLFAVPALFLGLMAPLHAAITWGPYRGANVNAGTLTETDVRDFAALGGNLLRVGFSHKPLMALTPPFDVDETAFQTLDQILEWGEKYHVAIVIDPHAVPGAQRRTTTLPRDVFWQSEAHQTAWVNLWKHIAERYAQRGAVIAGYDLLNEPAVSQDHSLDGPLGWNTLVSKMVAAIRVYDTTHTLIVEPIVGRQPGVKGMIRRFQGMDYLPPPPDPNLVYSPHLYEPGEFTHQGVNNRPRGPRYPGDVNHRHWDKETLRRAMAPALAFQRKYNVPIFVGEFSAARWTGEDGNRYIQDAIDLFEEFGWSWAYHAYRQAPVWDAEIGTDDPKDTRRVATTPRLEILKKAFARNAH